MRFLLTFIAMTVSALLLVPALALAQDSTINLGELVSPWLELLLGFFAVIIPALGAWAAAEIRRRTGIALELAHMQTFQQALLNGAGLLVTKATQMADNVTIDARHPAIRDAILYVNKSAPDAIAYFGLTPEQIAEKLVAKLGLINSASTDATGKAAEGLMTPPRP